MLSFKNYYSILGVLPTASPRELKSAFRYKAKLYSPDVNKEASAVTAFAEILEAWDVLSDPEKRKKYNDSIGIWQEGEPSVASCETDVYEQLRKSAPKFSSKLPGYAAEQKEDVTNNFESSDPVEQNLKTEQSRRRRWAENDSAEDLDYLERPQTAMAVAISFVLLFAWTLWVSGLFETVQNVVKTGLFALSFGAFSWLFFWGVRFYLSPKTLSPKRWAKVVCLPVALLLSFLYALSARWFLMGCIDFLLPAASFKEMVHWGGGFVLIFCVCTVVLER